jgi:hypothetical protein
MLTRVLSVTFGLPEPWMCSCVKRQSVDRHLDQLARTLDRDDLHRAAAIFVLRDVDEGHPQATRGDAVSVQQPRVVREKEVWRRRQHDADVHVPLHGDGRSELSLGNHHLANEAIQHPTELGEVRVGAELLRDLEDLGLRNSLVQVVQVVERIPHLADPIEDPLAEGKPIRGIVHDLRIPRRRQAPLELFVDVACLDRLQSRRCRRRRPIHRHGLVSLVLRSLNPAPAFDARPGHSDGLAPDSHRLAAIPRRQRGARDRLEQRGP